MSVYLWKYYLEDDVDNFRRLLATANYSASTQTRAHGSGGNTGLAVGSPGKGLSTSPNLRNKNKGSSEWENSSRSSKGAGGVTLTRTDINSKDAHSVSLLHHVASSIAEDALQYARALLDLPLLDIYAQDLESGWTALHRALYSGNVTIARALMSRDFQDAYTHTSFGGAHVAGGIIKIKDREGNSPFDVYGLSITSRLLHNADGRAILSAGLEDDEEEIAEGGSGDGSREISTSRIIAPQVSIGGDELFMFGSNKNLTLGFGDEDDRQFPERITLKRPDHLLRRLHMEYQRNARSSGRNFRSPAQERLQFVEANNLPALLQHSAIKIQDVQLSKLHTAVLTTDPEANLYICGFGQGGRLGTGDQATRFHFTCIYGGGLSGKKVVNIGLGQNHTIAISSHGEVFTWGNNVFGQLGYAIATSNSQQENPLQLLPRQVFGPLKRETCIGCAASRLHSVVFTKVSLYTFGKNEGQLGLVDSDARSLEIQVTPRKVAASLFSAPIGMVTANDKATICLLDNHEVWIFANYGYTRMAFPLDGFSNLFSPSSSHFSTRHDGVPNHIVKICSGGDTICAMARSGDVFTVTVSQKLVSSPTTSSTTNPAKIRGALSAPQRVWSLRKSDMAVRDVDVGQDGSIIICTEAGSVWKRVKRTKIKDASSIVGLADYKPKDYKFSRIPGLTRVTAVRSNAFGAFAAVRRDTDVLRTQITVDGHSIWKDIFPLLPFAGFSREEDSDTEEPTPRFWTPSKPANDPSTIRHAVLTSKDIETELADILSRIRSSPTSNYDIKVGSTLSDIRIPCHEFMLAARSEVLQFGLQLFREEYFYGIHGFLSIEYDKDGNALVLFQGLDILTIMNIVFYIYTDSVIDVWHHTRHAAELAFRYRQVRTELMKVASQLHLRMLEHAVRVMNPPPRTLHENMELAIQQQDYLETGDAEIELDGTNVTVHSVLLCQRCPFFEGLFHGRAGGGWLSSRRERLQEPEEPIKVDLKHVHSDIFSLVLRHIYADTGEELFDEITSPDLLSFLDFVIEVMSVANELMLERLVQICQKVLGRFVTTRNVCQLLNAVAPCSVTEFKNAALEYICLNLEGMLENQLLDELDEDLMLELDDVVRQNQLACLPFAKSGRAEAELLEAYPELVTLRDRDRRAKIDSMALQSRLHEVERKAVSNRTRMEVLNETKGSPLSSTTSLHSSNKSLAIERSLILTPRKSADDLMFDLDDDEHSQPRNTNIPTNEYEISNQADVKHKSSGQLQSPLFSLPTQDSCFDTKGQAIVSTSPIVKIGSLARLDSALTGSPNMPARSIDGGDLENERPRAGIEQPWKASNIASSKLDMKDIMAQASANRQSNIATALSKEFRHGESSRPIAATRLSQKERKKQMQQQQLQPNITPTSPGLPPSIPTPNQGSVSPWRTASAGAKISLKDVLQEKREMLSISPTTKARTPPGSSMTLRQTIPGNALSKEAKQESPQQRSVSTPNISTSTSSSSPIILPQHSPQNNRSQITTPLSSSSNAIRSVRYNAPVVEPSLQLSMADILTQQQTEKDIIKEAVAKRSLQEIQDEQAFQEWWDQEEAATRARLLEEETAARSAPGVPARGGRNTRGGRGRDRSSGRGRGRGGRRGNGESGKGLSRGRGTDTGM